jgi:hypothetical protein
VLTEYCSALVIWVKKETPRANFPRFEACQALVSNGASGGRQVSGGALHTYQSKGKGYAGRDAL